MDVPDDQRAAFKTRNGRKVLDGGGVTPDIKMDPVDVPDLIGQLEAQNMIFKYVNSYQQSLKVSVIPRNSVSMILRALSSSCRRMVLFFHNPAYRNWTKP